MHVSGYLLFFVTIVIHKVV